MGNGFQLPRERRKKTRQLGLPGNHQNGDPDWIRTNDTRFRKPVLYPLSYEAM